VDRRAAEQRAAALRKSSGLERQATEADAEAEVPEAPQQWRPWLRTMYPTTFTDEFGDRHADVFRFAWGVELGQVYPAEITIWPRGGGKTTTTHTAALMMLARGTRRFLLIVQETQKQANRSIRNLATKLQSPSMERYYPLMAERAVTKFGGTKQYNQQGLITASGAVAVGVGLDAAERGLNIEDLRPDIILLDDIDGRHDTPATVRKKQEILTDTILPMGTDETLVLGAQNLIHGRSLFSKLADGSADFLLVRNVSGPHPSLEGFEYEYQYRESYTMPSGQVVKLNKRVPIITAGTPTWAGQDVEACQQLIFRFGIGSFLRENQHKVKLVAGALWKQTLIDEARVDEAPPPLFRVVGVDPSGNKGRGAEQPEVGDDPEKPAGNECGIVVESLSYDGRIYTEQDASTHGDPDEWGRAVAKVAMETDADAIVAERNFGGEMVRAVIRNAFRAMGHERQPIPVILVNASRGKRVRAEPVAQLLPEGLQWFVGTHGFLEEELTTWQPGSGESPNRLDAKVWASTWLQKKLKQKDVSDDIPGSSVVGTGMA
jgi:hypothetical protein